MSLTDTLKNALSALTEGGLNRYRLPDTIFSTAKVAVTDPVASTNSDAVEVN
ncbi:hypothetical protein HVZ29_17385 [Escherichia coli]|nr:hypothetical protein HVZ29_17385 [Escherichia coli]